MPTPPRCHLGRRLSLGGRHVKNPQFSRREPLMPQVIFVNGAQIVGHDVPLDGVMVRCRSIEHLPGNQLEPGVPEREWSDAALLSTYTDPAVGFALTAA